MVIVTGIRQAVSIAVRVAKRYDAKYRYLDPTNKFIQKYVPPGYRKRAFQAKRYIDVGIGATLIYDLLNNDGNGSISQRPPSGKFRKTRNNFQQSRRGRKFSYKSSYRPKRCYGRRKFRY